MTRTLEERITSMKWTAQTDPIFVHTTDPKEDYSSFGAARGRQEQAKEAMKIIEELQAENQTLQKKLDEALRRVEWQPIETAPKDTRFLAVVNVGMRRYVHILRHCTEGEYGFDYGMFLSPDGAHYGKDTVSHWMPLPPKPTSLEEKHDK